MNGPQSLAYAGLWLALHALALRGLRRPWAWFWRPRALMLAGLLAACWFAAMMAAVGLGWAGPGATAQVPGALLWLGLFAAASGAGLAARSQSVPVDLLGLATLLLGDAMLSLLAWATRAGAPLPVSGRFLALAPPLCWLMATFAASLRVMLPRGAGNFVLAARVGRRLLVSRQGEVVQSVSRIAVLGVTLGVWLVLVAMGILSGFERDLRDKLVGANAHLTLTRADALPLALAAGDVQAVTQTGGAEVVAVQPFVETELAVASASNYAAALFLGVTPSQKAQALPLVAALPEAQKTALEGPCAPHCPLLMGAEMARNLGVGPGDRVRLIPAAGEVLTPMGPVPRSLGARVVGLIHSKMYETDSRLLLGSVALGQRLLQWQADAYSGLQVAARQAHDAERLAAKLRPYLADRLRLAQADLLPLTWMARNQTLFRALELERVVAAAVLTFIILVASFSIVNTLSMSIQERRHEIAMLKAMGANHAVVLQIFVMQGMFVGGVGTLSGAILGLMTLLGLQRFGFGIPYEVYYIDALPVDIAWADVVGVVAAALLILWNFAVMPSSRAAALTPAEGLRDG